MMKAAVFVTFFALIATVSEGGRSIIIRRPPQPLSSLNVNETQLNRRRCSFTVIIRTSCSSVRYTRDLISLAFGDAYGNQVYAPRLDEPGTRTFESCSTDTFNLYGPCTFDICYLYLYRRGTDGWKPYDVTVYGDSIRPIRFYYNVFMPSNVWYGFNICYNYGAADDAGKSTMKKQI